MRIKVIRPASRQNTNPDFMAHSAGVTASYASRGTEIETVFINAGHHGGSMNGHLNEARIMSAAPVVIQEVVKAEAEKWDAVVISGEYDVGAEIARHLVRIPVVDVGTASLRVAMLLGDSAALLIPQDSLNAYVRKLIRRWNAADFVGVMTAWNIPLAAAWDRRSEMRDLTLRICRDAMASADVNVIVPFCAVFVPFIVTPREIEDELGIPVVNGVAIAVKTAEMFVDLKLTQSRKAYPETAPTAWS